MSFRCFLDMDGVLADFDGLKVELGLTGDQLVERPSAFLDLKPVAGAIAAVANIEAMGFEVWVASRPAPSWPQTYADKASWIIKHLPRLKKRLILTQDKGLLGDERDTLIDDRIEKSNCLEFPGNLIHFHGDAPGEIAWRIALDELTAFAPTPGHGKPYWECGDGWLSLINPLVRLCNERDVQITQIKEKFAGLRFYVAEHDNIVDAAIQEAEAASFSICEMCGKPGTKRSNGHWSKTLCDDHAREWLSGR